jgi:short-subunit dehydrogenase
MENANGMPEILWRSPDEVANAALRDYDRGNAVCIPGALNKVAAAFSAAVPATVSRKVAGIVTKRAY